MSALPISKRRCGICGLADHAEGDCPIVVAGEAVVKDGRCCSCGHWTRNEDDTTGDCSCEKMIDYVPEPDARDVLMCVGQGCMRTQVTTGDWFGCVHWTSHDLCEGGRILNLDDADSITLAMYSRSPREILPELVVKEGGAT